MNIGKCKEPSLFLVLMCIELNNLMCGTLLSLMQIRNRLYSMSLLRLSVFKVQNTKEQYHVLIEIGYAISAIILLLLNLI